MLVGVVGFIGSGKGTVGDFLVQNHEFTTDSFARSLKDAAASIFGWERDMLEGVTKESRRFRERPDVFWSERLDRNEFTPREALQLLGTEAGRNVFGTDLWVAGVERRWIESGKPNTVITDCRFPNEVELIQRLGGHVIRVVRGPDPDWYQEVLFYNKGMCDEEDKRIMQQKKAMKIIPHDSETAWIGCDFDEIVHNEGTLEELEEEVKKLAEKYLEVENKQMVLGI